jgi:predicted aminopeptidase
MISSEKPFLTWNRRTRRRMGIGLGLAFCAFLATTCNACYVARSGWFQAELLLSREPIDTVRAAGVLNQEQLNKLDLIQDVKAFGGEIGLSATENYSRIAWDWNRTIWNVSACDPLNFRSESWWFPIVGRVPYLGFFRKKDADKWIHKLERKGLDVYLRSAGAYSTLGYFEDPILPGMLEWDDDRLANTVLHEMVHATVWIKGSVEFNESLASFVGDSASLEYLENRFGKDSLASQRTQDHRADIEKWRSLQRTLFGSLRAIYANPSLNETEKLTMKAQAFAQWPDRVAATEWHRSEGFVQAATEGIWNNARLMQFQAYNSYTSEFQRILDQTHGSYPDFIQQVNDIVSGSSDPFEALSQADNVQDF